MLAQIGLPRQSGTDQPRGPPRIVDLPLSKVFPMSQWLRPLWTLVCSQATAVFSHWLGSRSAAPLKVGGLEAESLRTTFGYYLFLSPLCICAALYLYAKVQYVPASSLTLEWIIVCVCFHTVRVICGLALIRQVHLKHEQIMRWSRISFWLHAFEGLMAMVFALWIWPLYPMVEQLFQLMAVMLLVAGTSFALSGRWRPIVAFALPTHLAFVWSASQLEHMYAQPVLVMVLMFFGLHFLNARGHHLANVQGIELARELELKNTQLYELAAGRSRLLATVSHDLRQPAHAIGLLCERAMLETQPGQLKQSLGDLNELSQSLSASLSTLMDLTRLDAGLVTANIQPLPLSQVLLRVEAEFAQSALKKELAFVVASSTWWVRSDPVLLHGVLSNLVSNAIKYTRAGRVDVELFKQDNEITISVRDTGMGIPPEKIDHIFKEFVRLDRADSSTEEGLGLGLSIVKRYAQLLDLKLSVSSQLNQGSCFSIRLQAIEAVAVHAQVRALSHAMSLNDTRLQGLRVLVVDNVELVLSSMLRTLAGWGCEVYGARSLAEASAVIEGITLNMVISDFHLGDKQPDGLVLIEHLRRLQGRHGHSLPALLMTGDVSGHLEAQARRCQVDVLHKPVRPDVLLHRVLSQLQLAPVSVAEAPVLL